ncbi:hypothetical protein D7X98_00010 [bacterium 1XD8-76]|nr:hypothetical protein D7X98_00010 [bacterium 1XD8-76]
MKKQVKIKKWLQGIDGMIILEIVAVCIMLIPVFIISFYTIPSADDFVNSVTIRTSMQNHRFYISAAISEVIYYYKNVSGYFFGAFLNFYISPLLRGGMGALRLTVFLLNLYFFVSLYFFINEFLRFFYNIRSLKVILFVYTLVLFIFINCKYNSEMTSWYCTMIGYIFIVACTFWGIIFFLKAIQSGEIKYAVLSSAVGFLASGGSLNLTALNCGMYLLVAYFGYKAYQKKKISTICFVSALAGAIINAVAPGNFIRHGVDSYPVFRALYVANYHVKQEMQELMFHSPFILLLCIFFVLMLKTIHNPRNIKGRSLIIFAGIIMLGAAVVNFPVCLGYIESYFPDRCVWVQNCVIYLGAFAWTACLAEWVKGKFYDLEIKKDVMICICISFLLYGCNLCVIRDPSDYPTLDMIKQIASGEIAGYVDYWEGVLQEIEYSEESEVVVTREEIRSNTFIRDPDLSFDKDYEMNVGIARYYGKDSVYITIGAEE